VKSPILNHMLNLTLG